jgi:hypothetical protein
VARIGERREGKSHLEDLGVDGRKILKDHKKYFGDPVDYIDLVLNRIK